ncbi:unnamed protein product [Symbiodinium sp. CCMP2592]|nr:unnamed protein product [Symbiodinium sp. CCMP2592]
MAAAPEFIMGAPPVTLPHNTPLEQFQNIVSQTASHVHEPMHELRWPERTILMRLREAFAVFFSHIAMISATLELYQWKNALIEVAQTIDHYCDVTLNEGIIHLDCPLILQIADIIQSGLTMYCQQMSRFTGKVAPMELQLGWIVTNRWAHVMTPDGYSSHCGYANCAFLNLIHVCNSCIARMLASEIEHEIPVFALDLSCLILDRAMECHWALKQIFAMTLYRARSYGQIDELVD